MPAASKPIFAIAVAAAVVLGVAGPAPDAGVDPLDGRHPLTGAPAASGPSRPSVRFRPGRHKPRGFRPADPLRTRVKMLIAKPEGPPAPVVLSGVVHALSAAGTRPRLGALMPVRVELREHCPGAACAATPTAGIWNAPADVVLSAGPAAKCSGLPPLPAWMPAVHTPCPPPDTTARGAGTPTFTLELLLGHAAYYMVLLDFELPPGADGGAPIDGINHPVDAGPGVTLFTTITGDPEVTLLLRPFAERSDTKAAPLHPAAFSLPAGGFGCFLGKTGVSARMLPYLVGAGDRVALMKASSGAEGWQLDRVADGFSFHYNGDGGARDDLGADLRFEASELVQYPVYAHTDASSAAADRIYCLAASLGSSVHLLEHAKGALAAGQAGDVRCGLPDSALHAGVEIRNRLSGDANRHVDDQGTLQLPLHNVEATGAEQEECDATEHGMHHAADSCYLIPDAASAVRFIASKGGEMTPTGELGCLAVGRDDGSTCYEPVAPCHRSLTVDNDTCCPPPSAPAGSTLCDSMAE